MFLKQEQMCWERFFFWVNYSFSFISFNVYYNAHCVMLVSSKSLHSMHYSVMCPVSLDVDAYILYLWLQAFF